MEKGTMRLRTNVLLLLIIIIYGTSLASSWNINVSGGPGLTTMNSSPTIGGKIDNSRISGCFSFGVTYSFNKWLNVYSGFDYQAKGYLRNLSVEALTIQEEYDGIEFFLEAHRDYLQVPLLISITVPTGIRIHPFIELGPSLAFNVSAHDEIILKVTDSYVVWENSIPTIKDEIIERSESVDPMQNNEKAFRKFDMPVTIATGMRLTLKDIELLFCLRYDIGLFSFVKEKSGDVDNRYIISYGDKNSPEIEEYTERYNFLTFLFGVSIPIEAKKSKKR